MNLRAIIFGFFVAIISFIVVLMSFLFIPMKYIELVIKKCFLIAYKLVNVKISSTGLGNIDPEKSYIYISNHSSLIDIPSVKICLPLNVKFIAKKELFKIPFFGFVLKRLGQIPIDRTNKRKAIQSLNVAKERLKKGYSIWMAPEGTRNVDGNINIFKKGAFVTARQADVEVIPVSLCGTWKILPKKKLQLNSGKIDVIINKPVEVEKDNVEGAIAKAHKIISDDIKKWKNMNE